MLKNKRRKLECEINRLLIFDNCDSDSTDLSTQVRILFQPRMLLPLPYLEKSIRSIF